MIPLRSQSPDPLILPIRCSPSEMPQIEVKQEWCKGCYICVEFCPRNVLERDETVFVRGFHPVVVVRPEDCTACRLCELLCPDLAIAVSEED